jgi:hypothetical protein
MVILLGGWRVPVRVVWTHREGAMKATREGVAVSSQGLIRTNNKFSWTHFSLSPLPRQFKVVRKKPTHLRMA